MASVPSDGAPGADAGAPDSAAAAMAALPQPPLEGYPPYCDPAYVMPEVISVALDRDGLGPHPPDCEVVSVAVARPEAPKPYQGGYRHKKTGKVYHHASTATGGGDLRGEPRAASGLRHRDTQTYDTATRSVQSKRECGTQMQRKDVLLDNSTDTGKEAKPYFSADQLLQLKREKSLVIQCYWRGYVARRRTWAIREGLYQKQLLEEKAEQAAREEAEKSRKHEIERRIAPKTAKDFELLYNELEQWRHKETARIKGDPTLDASAKRLQASELLAKETKALQTIDRLKSGAAKGARERRIQQMMGLMAKPKQWEMGDGEVAEVHTPFTVRAQELFSLHTGLTKPVTLLEDRLDLLMQIKWTVSEFDCPLTREVVELCDREADLLDRGRSESSIDGLRSRIASLFLQFIETPSFNPESRRFMKIPTGKSV